MPGESGVTVVTTTTFFLTSLVLTLVALSSPFWIVSDFEGETQYGLLVQCQEHRFMGKQEFTCGTPSGIAGEWHAATFFLISGAILMCGAVAFAVMSYSRSRYMTTAKWLAFATSALFSLASLIFPIGFNGEPIGGSPFKLPEKTRVGFAYIQFIIALLLIFVGELFAMKILCPVD